MPTLQTPIRYLPSSVVDALMPAQDEQLALVETVYRAIREGTCQAPASDELAPRPKAFAHALPAYVEEGDIVSVKWVSGNAGNRANGLPYQSSLIVVNDSESGLPMAVMDGSAITAARTAAVSVACVRSFAREGWSTVAIIGYGIQSVAHVKALAAVNESARFHVFSRRPLDVGDGRISAAPDPRAAIDGADVVITGMPLEETLQPPVAFDWLTADALVLPLDDDASLEGSVVNGSSAFYVDDIDDYRLRQAVGRFPGWREPDGAVGEAIPVGRGADGVIVCANQGMGLLDAVFARSVLDAAERDGAGVLLDR